MLNDALDHRHMIVTVYATTPPMTAQAGEDWLRKLVEIVEMEILLDAQAIYCEDLGNEGVTGIVGLTTSHASFHSWHNAEEPFVSFDLYSCMDFSIESIFEHLKEWGMTRCNYLVIDRNPALPMMQITQQGSYSVA